MTKLYQFVNGLKPFLKEVLLLRQPPDYNAAVSYSKLKDSTSTYNYAQLLKQIKLLTHTNTQQESPVSSLNYPDPVKLTEDNEQRKTRIKQLDLKKILLTVLFPSHKINLRTGEDQPICNRCKKVIQNKFVDKFIQSAI